MKNLYKLILALLVGTAYGQSNLPACPIDSSKYWDKCYGTYIGTSDKVRYTGEFSSNHLNGKGSVIYPDNRRYEGEFKYGKFHGKGTFYNPDGSIYRIGNWQENMFTDEKNLDKEVVKTYTPIEHNNNIPESTSLEVAKNKCEEIGFKPATEGFGKCVLQLSK